MTEVAGEKEQTGEGQGEEEGRNGGMANGTRGVIARARKMRSTGGADREHEEEGGERGGPKFPPVAFDGCFFCLGVARAPLYDVCLSGSLLFCRASSFNISLAKNPTICSCKYRARVRRKDGASKLQLA